MNITGNTILITGGASGIGQALAEAFHARGNQVIISGRRQQALDAVTAANPGMKSVRMDIGDKAGVQAFAEQVTRDYPALNVVINNAGIMQTEDLKTAADYLGIAEETIATNLLGPIRLTAGLLPHLLRQPHATVVTVSSGLAFVPMVMTPTYSATKAAIHSYSMSLRQQLRGTTTSVIELVPPYVQTHLMGEHQANDPSAMPLDGFIAEVMDILTNEPDVAEVVVKRCEPLRFAAESGTLAAMVQAVNG
ncbi:MAG TPA: SDR family oxidoreductase [Rhodopila sp.]|jgi:uncharacterized oxidoreductase|nr:SDR family oxidoreductase [Rhodopila sp.]